MGALLTQLAPYIRLGVIANAHQEIHREMGFEARDMYACPECGDWRPSYGEAKACCLKDPVCPVCDTDHDGFRAAAQCCLGRLESVASRMDEVVATLEEGGSWRDATRRVGYFNPEDLWLHYVPEVAHCEDEEFDAEERYVCLGCETDHEDLNEAMDCCPSIECPACGLLHFSFREAADCCLWHDLDIVTRWSIADRVEAGATWAEALQEHNN